MRIYSNKKRPVKASNDGRKWVNTELTQDEYAKFRNFLKKKGYKYETSGAGDMVHIEAYLNEAEIKEADNFLDTLDDVNGACGKKSVKADSFLRSTRKSDDGTFSYTVDTDKLYLGVPGAYFIWKGEWGDPWVEYDGGVYNASDLDSGVYSDFEEYCEENGLTFSDWRDEDNAFDEWAKEYGRDSAEGWLYDMSPFAKVIETSGDYRWAKEIGVNASTHTGIGASEDKHDSKFRVDIYQRNNPDALITREYKRFKTEDEAKNYGRSISKGNEVVVNEVKESTRRRPVKASSNRKRTPIMAGAGIVTLDDMNTDVIPVVDFGTYGGPLSYALEDVFVADYLEVDNLDPENEDEAGALELINEGYDGTQDFFNQVLGLAPLYIQDAFDQYGIPAKVVSGSCEWNHPREYNYYDDTIEFNMTIDADWVASKFAELSNEPKFADFLNDSFSSRSGFISFMPNEVEDYNDLLDPNSSDYWKVVSAIVKFMVYGDPSIRNDVTEDMIEYLRGNSDYASLSSYGIY